MKVSDLFYYRQKSKQRNYRYDIFARDDYHCWYCGRDLAGVDAISCNAEITLDHKYPQAQGGDESNENLVTCCRHCNLLKGNKTIDEFRAAIKLRCLNQVITTLESLHKYSHLFTHTDDFLEITDTLSVVESQISALAVDFYGERPPDPVEDSTPLIQHESEYSQ